MKNFLGKFCKPSPVSFYRMIFSVITAYVVIFSFDLIVHVVLLMPCYLATADVWNPRQEMGSRQLWYPVIQLMSAITISVFYVCWRYRGEATSFVVSRRKLYSDGLGFGGFAGLLSGISMAGFYIYLPISGTIAAAWLVSELIKGMAVGLALTAVYPSTSTSNA